MSLVKFVVGVILGWVGFVAVLCGAMAIRVGLAQCPGTGRLAGLAMGLFLLSLGVLALFGAAHWAGKAFD